MPEEDKMPTSQEMMEQVTEDIELSEGSKDKKPKEEKPLTELEKLRADYNALTDRFYEQQRLLEELSIQNQQLQQSQTPTRPTTEGMPDIEEYGNDPTDPNYLMALTRWTVRDELNNFAKQQQEAAINAKIADRNTKFNKAVEAYGRDNPEYMEMLQTAEGNQYPGIVSDFVMESEYGPALDYHLLKNPSLQQELAGLTPMQMVKRLNTIEMELMQPSTPPPNEESSAEPPIDTVGAGGSQTNNIYDKNMPYDRYVAMRSKGQG